MIDMITPLDVVIPNGTKRVLRVVTADHLIIGVKPFEVV